MVLTIITITLNNLDGLKKTLKSINNQSMRELIEHVIIDGGSVDGTFEYLNDLLSCCNTKWISEKDRGISDAFNKGIHMASGDIILMLNAGDILNDANVVRRVFDDWQCFNTDILSYRATVGNITVIPISKDWKKVWGRCEIAHQATFVSKQVYNQVGWYSEEYKIRMDYQFFARCRKHNCRFQYIPIEIVKYEPGGISMNSKNRFLNWREALSVKLMYGLRLSLKDIIKIMILFIKK